MPVIQKFMLQPKKPTLRGRLFIVRGLCNGLDAAVFGSPYEAVCN